MCFFFPGFLRWIHLFVCIHSVYTILSVPRLWWLLLPFTNRARSKINVHVSCAFIIFEQRAWIFDTPVCLRLCGWTMRTKDKAMKGERYGEIFGQDWDHPHSFHLQGCYPAGDRIDRRKQVPRCEDFPLIIPCMISASERQWRLYKCLSRYSREFWFSMLLGSVCKR